MEQIGETVQEDGNMSDDVNHPVHYGGEENAYEAIKVIEAWDLDFNLGNTVKYIARAGRKDPSKKVEDLEKARFYLNRAIEREKSRAPPVKSSLDSLTTAYTVPVCLKCGGSPQILFGTDGAVYARCRKCGWKTGARDTEEQAISAWSGQMMFGKKEDMRCSMEQ